MQYAARSTTLNNCRQLESDILGLEDESLKLDLAAEVMSLSSPAFGSKKCTQILPEPGSSTLTPPIATCFAACSDRNLDLQRQRKQFAVLIHCLEDAKFGEPDQDEGRVTAPSDKRTEEIEV